MKRFRPVIDCKEKENACEKIKSQRMHITHAMTGEKLICQFPRANDEEAERSEKLRVPIQELIEKVDDHIPERAAIIDCWLAALRAPMSVQLCATIFAMRDRRALRFSPAEESPSTRGRLFNFRNRSVAQNELCYFVGHLWELRKSCLARLFGMWGACSFKPVRRPTS